MRTVRAVNVKFVHSHAEIAERTHTVHLRNYQARAYVIWRVDLESQIVYKLLEIYYKLSSHFKYLLFNVGCLRNSGVTNVLFTAHWPMYSAHWPMYSAHWPMYSAHWPMYTAHWPMREEKNNLPFYVEKCHFKSIASTIIYQTEGND